jgi:hypothetical protein
MRSRATQKCLLLKSRSAQVLSILAPRPRDHFLFLMFTVALLLLETV